MLDYQELNDWSSEFEQEAGAEHVAVLIPEVGRGFKRSLGPLRGEVFGVEKLPIPNLLNQGLISYFFGARFQFEGISLRPAEGTTDFFMQKSFEIQEGVSGAPQFVNRDLGLGIVDS